MKGGYALELRFHNARSTVDIDLTLERVASAVEESLNADIQRMLQRAADTALGDWFEYIVGPPVMDLTAAPCSGARYSVEARMDARTFARFQLDARVGDVVIRPHEEIQCRD